MMDEKTIKILVRDCVRDKAESEILSCVASIEDIMDSYCTSILQALQKGGLDLETIGMFHVCAIADLVYAKIFPASCAGYGEDYWKED